MRSETCTPMWLDSAMIGPAAMRATADGSRAMTGASAARKVRKRRATMNSTDSSSTRLWMWPFWFCTSTEAANPPVRCMTRPGGAPEVANVDRSAATAWSEALFSWVFGISISTSARRARWLADDPWSRTAVTRGTERMACSLRSMAAWSAAVRTPPSVVAATNVVALAVLDWNGAASCWATTLGSEAGRKLELPLFSTLVREGRARARTTVVMIQPAMISHRNRTVNRPKEANKR